MVRLPVMTTRRQEASVGTDTSDSMTVPVSSPAEGAMSSPHPAAVAMSDNESKLELIARFIGRPPGEDRLVPAARSGTGHICANGR